MSGARPRSERGRSVRRRPPPRSRRPSRNPSPERALGPLTEPRCTGAAMRLSALSLAAATALLAGACSGPAEDAAHERANAVDAAGERQADALERQAAATSDEAKETALNRQA